MSVREDLAEGIRQAWEGDPPRILPYARPVDNVPGPLVMLERTQVAKAPNAIGGYFETFTIHAVVATTDRDHQDDALDTLLDDLLDALDSLDWIKWSTAVRSVFLESWPSFQIDVLTATDRTKGV